MDLVWEALGEGISLIARADAELIAIASLSPWSRGCDRANLAAAIGIPLGLALQLGRFPGELKQRCWSMRHGAATRCGGAAGDARAVANRAARLARLLFTPTAMVVAQVAVA